MSVSQEMNDFFNRSIEENARVFLERYAAHKGKSMDVERHSNIMKMLAGKMIMSKKRIYLDTNFWIMLRNAEMGCGKTGSEELLSICYDVSDKENVAFVTSQHVFLEVMKQSSDSTRLATCNVMDRLTKGYTLLSLADRWMWERTMMVRKKFYGVEEDPALYVWGRGSCMMGSFHVDPSLPPDSEIDKVAFQKAFFDAGWVSSFSMMVSIIDQQKFHKDEDISSILNSNKMRSKEGWTTKRMLETYIWCTMNANQEHVDHTMCELKNMGIDISLESLKDTLADIAASPDGTKIARSYLVFASLSANATWDTQRNIKPNDNADVHHATAAVAYCNIFMTESPLRRHLEINPWAISQKMGCTVISSISEAIELLKTV